VISKINYDKLNMLTMIKEVSTVVPYGVYLRSFDTTSSTNIHISGVAVSNKSVADFLNNLAKSKVFDTVNLIHTKIMYTKFGIFQDFKIVVTVKMSHNSGVSDKVYDAFGEAKNKLVRAIGPSPMGPSPTLNG
uniref:PilN domain-containing protein n=2 Tax=Candidatus Ichthyocystis TaxID=2929841 RepID=UPI0011128A1B